LLSNWPKPSPHNPGWDVFEEDQGGTTLGHDPQEVGDWPVAVFSPASGIGVALLFAGKAVRLAGQASTEDVHHAKKRSGIEGSKVAAPNRCRLHARVCHPRQLDGRGVTFPLNESRSSRSGKDETDGSFEHPDARA
jgi:hypothetical protein